MDAQFEGKLLLFRAVLPFLLGILAQWLFFAGGFRSVSSNSVRSNAEGESQNKGTAVWGAVWLVLGCLTVWIAFLVSDFGSRGILLDQRPWSAWEAREPWMHWVWSGPLVLSLWVVAEWMFVWREPSGGFGQAAFGKLRWLLIALGIGVLSWMMFPRGEGYVDQIPRFRALGLCAFVTSMLNAALLGCRMDATKSPWLGWANVVQAACVAAVVLQSYASLGEWVVFSASMLVGVLSVGVFCRGCGAAGPLFRMLGFASVAGLCVSQAYAWNPLPIWLLLVLALVPTIVVALDGMVGRLCGDQSCGDQSWGGQFWVRLAVFATLVLAVLALLYFFVLQAEPQW